MKHLRRLIFFILLFTAFLLTGLLVWWELLVPMNLAPWMHQAALILCLGSLALLSWHLLRIHVKKPSSLRVFVTFGLAGLFIHLLCAVLIKILIIWIPGVFTHEQTLCRWMGFAAIMLNFLGIHSALRGPLVKRVEVQIAPHLKTLDGFKIVQISDLHIGPLIRRGYVSEVVDRVKVLGADLIVLTGDIADSDPDFYRNEAHPLQRLHAPEGVFYILGNHEYYWDANAWIRVFEKLNLKPLINEGIMIRENIWLGGITDPDAGYFIPEHQPDAQQAIGSAKSSRAFKILLAHQPKSCFDAEKAGFDLMLSGHTHGGQFFPLNFIVGWVNPYSKGLNRHGKMFVYVNQGTGFWGPALRLGVPAEITLITLKA